MGITFLRNTLQTQCKTLRKPSGDVQRISSSNKREGRPKASLFLVIVLPPPRPRLRSVPAPLRFASPRNIDGRTERQYHDSTCGSEGRHASLPPRGGGALCTLEALLQDVPGLVAAYDANPSVLTARRSAPKRATKAPAQPLRRSRRGCAAVHALWTPLGRPVLLRLT